MSENRTTPSLEETRARIDAIDGQLLGLLDARAALSAAVAAAKAGSPDAGKFGLRPGREAAIIRRLLAEPRSAASPQLVVRVWRELMAANLAAQGAFNLTAWGGRDPGRIAELTRQRFGAAPTMTLAAKPEDALAAARQNGGVAVLALTGESAWWGRLLAEPRLKVFAALPDFAAGAPPSALAVADVLVEPTGDDFTFWVTDAPGPAAAIEAALGRDGVAGSFLLESGGLKLFLLSAYYQAEDERLARAPGALSGVIGAAPAPLDA